MSTEQINEIISLLQAIADSSMANKIAFIATLVSACALLSSIYFNHKANAQYLNSLSPLLSCELSENAGVLYLAISNTGQSKATKIKVSLEKISNNGEQNKFVTDDIFKEELELYPNEKIMGQIAFSGGNVVTRIAPIIQMRVSYCEGNTQKTVKYDRKVCFTKSIDKNEDISEKIGDISKKLNEISYSNNRMANYFEGRCLFKFDELNVLPHNSLYKDMKDAFHDVEHSESEEGRNEKGNLKRKSNKAKNADH